MCEWSCIIGSTSNILRIIISIAVFKYIWAYCYTVRPSLGVSILGMLGAFLFMITTTMLPFINVLEYFRFLDGIYLKMYGSRYLGEYPVGIRAADLFRWGFMPYNSIFMALGMVMLGVFFFKIAKGKIKALETEER